jgi:ABC-2 type transport system ATP-binding protein
MIPALEVAGLSHRFGKRTVLDDIGFSVPPGSFTVLLGPNGAGKTTLFALITRLYHATQGRIAVFGRDFRADPQAALARMGVVFQQSTLDLDLTVEQNHRYHAALHGMASSVSRPLIAAELERVGLLERRHDRARDLSGGQRRRVELARALLHEPALLLMDEPTAGLDFESRGFLLRHVRHLCADRGLAVLWATHLIEEADDSEIVILRAGRIVAQGPSNDVVTSAGATGLQDAFERLLRVPA